MVGTALEREADLQRLYPVWENDTQWTWFEKNSKRFSEQIFLIDEDQSYTYREIRIFTWKVSAGFYKLGIYPGMHVAVNLSNRKELIASVFALSRLGCTAVMVNPKITDLEREYVLKKADVKFLITEKRIIEIEEGKFKENKELTWQELLKNSDFVDEEELAEIEQSQRNPERTSMIIFTSGSTSEPKGVQLTDNMLLRSAFATVSTRHMEIGRRIYLPIPLIHAMAYVEAMLPALTIGGSIVISRKKLTAKEHFRRMQKYKVNDIVCISSIMIRMMMAPERCNQKFPHMHAAYWAGECPVWVWEQVKDTFGIQDCGNGYGMTECGSTSNIMGPCDPNDQVPFCHGKIKQAGVAAVPRGSNRILSMKIVKDDGKTECEPGECGEILMKGISITKGYYQDDEATKKLLDVDGWLHSGDLGKIDVNGYLTFLGRKDDMFKVNGENVSPKYVENVLLKNSNVRYAEVVGIPHESCGQAGIAFIEFYEEQTSSVSELHQYAKKHLARFQQPCQIISMSARDWPKTSSGKVSKMELKKMAIKLWNEYVEKKSDNE